MTISDANDGSITTTIPNYNALSAPIFGITDATYSTDSHTYNRTREYGDFTITTIYDSNKRPQATEMLFNDTVVYRVAFKYNPQSQVLKTEIRDAESAKKP